MAQTVLVTGAAGFIGSHLSEALLRRGHVVVGVDCFTDYYPRPLKEANLQSLQGQENFTFVEADLLGLDLDALLRGQLSASGGDCGQAFSAIYHLAAQPGVRGSWGERFGTYVRNNIRVTQRLLEAAIKAGKPRVIYASSSSVYGDQSQMPVREDMVPAPVSPYGVTKLAAEHLCRLYHHERGLPIIALRLFTVYGPRQRPDMAFSRFFRALLAGDEIPVYGDGTQTRDFTYVTDVVQAFVAALDRGAAGAVYNVAGGATISLSEALALVAEVTGLEPRLRRLPPQPGDVRDTWADTGRSRADLSFTPAVGLREGLARQWEYVSGGA